MVQILIKLFALYGTLKNLHYSVNGLNFYSIHKLADDMSDGLLSFADEIQENYYLGQGLPAVDMKMVMSGAYSEICAGDAVSCLKGSLLTINELIQLCEEESTPAVEDIFSRLNNHLFKIKGFVLKTLV